jgi:DNA-binding transcriptional LysR family regulator
VVQDIKPIRVFLKVAELKSFAAAARTLDMTPASVTRIVARFENDLDTQLLKRTTRQVALTSAGARVAARFAPIVEQFDQVAGEVARAARPDHGRLAINAPMSLGLRLLPNLIDSFRLAYPNVTLNVQLTDKFVDIVEETCDLAIRISGPPTDKSTIWRKICEVPRHAIAAPGLFDRIDRPQTPDDLKRELCMSYSANGGSEIWRFRKAQITRNIPAGTELVSNSGDFLYSLVKSGDGIAVLPDFIFKDALARKEVEQLLDDWEIQPLWLTLFYPPYETLPPLVASFSDFFEAYLRDVGELEF